MGSIGCVAAGKSYFHAAIGGHFAAQIPKRCKGFLRSAAFSFMTGLREAASYLSYSGITACLVAKSNFVCWKRVFVREISDSEFVQWFKLPQRTSPVARRPARTFWFSIILHLVSRCGC